MAALCPRPPSLSFASRDHAFPSLPASSNDLCILIQSPPAATPDLAAAASPLASDLLKPPLRTNRSLLDIAGDRGTQDMLLLGLCFFHSRPRSSIVLAVVPLDGAWLLGCIARASECEGTSPWSPWQAPPSSDSAQGPLTVRTSLLRLSSLPPELRYSYPKATPPSSC